MGEIAQAPTPTPERVEPALTGRGLGAGAGAEALAGGAPTVECRKYYYRNNIKMPGRTQYYLIDVGKWEILEPTREERSRTGAHGEDIYCLEQEKWRNIIVVKLERSNSGKVRYWVGSDNPELRNTIAKEIEEILATCRDIEDMEESVKIWVEARRLTSISG